MAEYTYKQIKDMKVAELRKIADEIEHEALQGHSTMHKDKLLGALCTALGLHEQHAAAGANKGKIKTLIRSLKTQRDEAKASGDGERLAAIRHQIHALKHRLRTMALGSV